MQTRSYLWRLAVGATAVMACLSLTSPSQGDNGVRQDGNGQFAKLTADWWVWAYSLPVTGHPLFDETGEDADTGQEGNKAFFLGGVFNESGTASRAITIPEGTPLFGPVINVQFDNVFFDPPLTIPELRAQMTPIVDEAEFFLELNGEERPDLVARIKSPVFDYVLPEEDNIYQFFGFDVTGQVKPSISDGYWFYIPPLPPGDHTLHFSGAFPSQGFSLSIDYEITVVPDP